MTGGIDKEPDKESESEPESASESASDDRSVSSGVNSNETGSDVPGSGSERIAGREKHFLELKIPPVGVFAIFSLLFWAIDRHFPVFDVEIPFRMALVVFLVAVALLIGAWSLWLFYRNETTPHAHKPHDTEKIVTTGPYKHTRNPMYLALSIVLIAQAIFLTDFLALMLMPAFYAYMTRFQIIPEERHLIEIFGEDYEEYAEKTPRWL